MKKFVRGVLFGAAAVLGTVSAQAATICDNTDITPNAVACVGFKSGNLLNNKPSNIQAQKDALKLLGFEWDGSTILQKVDGLGGSQTVDFSSILSGVSYVAFHFGNGQGGPGQATAFYKIDSNVDIDKLTLIYKASSNAVLYATGLPTSAVPEPGTWALLITGFGMIGYGARRRAGRVAIA